MKLALFEQALPRVPTTFTARDLRKVLDRSVMCSIVARGSILVYGYSVEIGASWCFFFVCWHSSNVEMICRYGFMDGWMEIFR